jgi:DNA polymerase-4
MIAHVDLDAFFASIEQLLHPRLRGKAIVVGGDPDHGGVVSSASYEARRYGVRSAMPTAQAIRLCPHAEVVGSTPGAVRDFSRRVMDILGRFTPVMEITSVDEAYLDLAGTERLHGEPFAAACRMRDEVHREVGLSVSIGVAVNPLVAKIASELCKPGGVMLAPEGMEAAMLEPLEVDRIPGVGPRTQKALASFGIERIRDLRRLDEDYLARTFGVWGRRLYEVCRGIDGREIGGQSQRKSISRETTFSEGRGDRRALEGILIDLLDDVVSRLRRKNLSARCVTVKIRYTDFDTHTASRSIKTHESDEKSFREPMLALFRRLYTRPERLRLVGVGLSDLREGGLRQGDLFEDEEDRRRAQKVGRLLDDLRDRFGVGIVRRGGEL